MFLLNTTHCLHISRILLLWEKSAKYSSIAYSRSTYSLGKAIWRGRFTAAIEKTGVLKEEKPCPSGDSRRPEKESSVFFISIWDAAEFSCDWLVPPKRGLSRKDRVGWHSHAAERLRRRWVKAGDLVLIEVGDLLWNSPLIPRSSRGPGGATGW